MCVGNYDGSWGKRVYWSSREHSLLRSRLGTDLISVEVSDERTQSPSATQGGPAWMVLSGSHTSTKRHTTETSSRAKFQWPLRRKRSTTAAAGRKQSPPCLSCDSTDVHAFQIHEKVDLSNALWIPGSHESASFYGLISTCQRHTLSTQLHLGVRFLDLRFSVKQGILRAYHGIQSQRAAASTLFEELYTFLDHHPSECVIVSVEQEDAQPNFEDLMRQLLDRRPDLWFLENRFPALAEVRGRLVLFSRYGHAPHRKTSIDPRPRQGAAVADFVTVGIHPSRWPFNSPTPFDYTIQDIKVVTQDWSSIISPLRIPEKFERVAALALSPSSEAYFKLNFASATAIYGGVPRLIAHGFGWQALGLGLRGVNIRLLDLLRQLQQEPGLKRPGGQCFMMDYVDVDLAAAIVSLNSTAAT